MSKFDPLAAEGFDVATALRQLAGSEKLYLSIITKFSTLYKDLPETIRADLEKGDLVKVQRDAHTVKGLAGTLGHGALREAAAQLEHAATGGDAAECAQRFTPFREIFAQVLGSLQNILNA
ncbi:MAG: Hpt domain-containing protein [Deltaproteobacteria bacterium]|jgi:two-component system sensor histidine kinase/response regulator|nr:Hpt domain-containing protein [Deltaproteobacteria bacterium]